MFESEFSDFLSTRRIVCCQSIGKGNFTAPIGDVNSPIQQIEITNMSLDESANTLVSVDARSGKEHFTVEDGTLAKFCRAGLGSSI